MKQLERFLKTSYTAYQATENAASLLSSHGFLPLREEETWTLRAGGKYFVERGGSALIAFTVGKGAYFKLIASHTDSPCLKLKDRPRTETEPFLRLNVEPYGGGIWYSFFDRPLRLAGCVVREVDGVLRPDRYVSDFTVVIPSLAVHMQRDVNEKFAPDPQVDLLPLLGLGKDGKKEFEALLGNPVAFDLFAACDEPAFYGGADGEFFSSPRLDNLTSVFGSLQALLSEEFENGVCVAACLDHEEVGSHTRTGAGGDFLKDTLARIAEALQTPLPVMAARSFMISLDNAHSLHPNRPEKCDPTNRAVLGGGVVIKRHAGRAYTTEALSAALIAKLFERAQVRFQTFYNRSDMRSGGTLGAISLGQVSMLSADLGLAQLAMHSAVETFAPADYKELQKGLLAFYRSELSILPSGVTIR